MSRIDILRKKEIENMAGSNKTQTTEVAPLDFIAQIEDTKRKSDAIMILSMMNELFSESPKMWGPSIIGYGDYHYKYESGREGDFFKVGFSPRKQAMTIYIMPSFERFKDLLSKLGKHKTGKSCLYIKKLEDVDLSILKELIKASYNYMTSKYG